MMATNNINEKKHGNTKRIGVMTTVLAAVILIILSKIYPLVPITALGASAVLLALLTAAVFNFLFERVKR